VSDAMVATSEFLEVCGCGTSHSERQRIASFIIPKPKPDPLEYKHKVLRRIELRQPHTDALKIAREALEAFIDRFDSNWRTDTDYVAHLVRKALAALEQIK